MYKDSIILWLRQDVSVLIYEGEREGERERERERERGRGRESGVINRK